jgi:hypothetical protein
VTGESKSDIGLNDVRDGLGDADSDSAGAGASDRISPSPQMKTDGGHALPADDQKQ